MVNRLVRIGDQGFNFDAVVGWSCQTDPEQPDNRVMYLHLSQVSKELVFRSNDAVLVQQWLNNISQEITATNQDW